MSTDLVINPRQAQLIDGRAAAAELTAAVAAGVERLRARHQITPGLAVVLVGDDPASQVYVASKQRQSLKAGMKTIECRLPASADFETITATIEDLNDDESIDGILVQLPLPAGIDSAAVIDCIDPDKDVDGLTIINTGLLALQREGFVPCTPQGVMHLLDRSGESFIGRHAVIIGRSNLVGKPLGQLLLARHCTVTIAHSRTRDLPALCAQADILIAAVGVAELVEAHWIRPGAMVIDVGINRVGGGAKPSLVGDVAFASAKHVAGGLTPVPGGVGPMTVACLLVNTLKASCLRRGPDFATIYSDSV